MLEGSISGLDMAWTLSREQIGDRGCRMLRAIAVQTCFCRCNVDAVFLVQMQGATRGGTAQRAMHNSDFDPDREGPLNSGTVMADLY